MYLQIGISKIALKRATHPERIGIHFCLDILASKSLATYKKGWSSKLRAVRSSLQDYLSQWYKLLYGVDSCHPSAEHCLVFLLCSHRSRSNFLCDQEAGCHWSSFNICHKSLLVNDLSLSSQLVSGKWENTKSFYFFPLIFWKGINCLSLLHLGKKGCLEGLISHCARTTGKPENMAT